MKYIILFFIIFLCSCNINNKNQLRSIKKQLEQGVWETSYKVSKTDTFKKEYSVFKEFKYLKNKLLCTQEFNSNKSNYERVYFTVVNSKILKCYNKTQTCLDMEISRDSMIVHWKDEQGNNISQLYKKTIR